jgi:hypothetical protein
MIGKGRIRLAIVALALAVLPLACSQPEPQPTAHTWSGPTREEVIGLIRNHPEFRRGTVATVDVPRWTSTTDDGAAAALERHGWLAIDGMLYAATPMLLDSNFHYRDDTGRLGEFVIVGLGDIEAVTGIAEGQNVYVAAFTYVLRPTPPGSHLAESVPKWAAAFALLRTGSASLVRFDDGYRITKLTID